MVRCCRGEIHPGELVLVHLLQGNIIVDAEGIGVAIATGGIDLHGKKSCANPCSNQKRSGRMHSYKI